MLSYVIQVIGNIKENRITMLVNKLINWTPI